MVKISYRQKVRNDFYDSTTFFSLYGQCIPITIKNDVVCEITLNDEKKKNPISTHSSRAKVGMMNCSNSNDKSDNTSYRAKFLRYRSKMENWGYYFYIPRKFPNDDIIILKIKQGAPLSLLFGALPALVAFWMLKFFSITSTRKSKKSN